jgi:hypothetical protein
MARPQSINEIYENIEEKTEWLEEEIAGVYKLFGLPMLPHKQKETSEFLYDSLIKFKKIGLSFHDVKKVTRSGRKKLKKTIFDFIGGENKKRIIL